MKRFYFVLCAVLMATCGFCQDLNTVNVDALLPVEADEDVLFVEEGAFSEGLIMAELPEGLQEEEGDALSPDSLGISVTPKFDYKESKYWGSYTALRTAGWLTLGTGVAFFISGYACILSAWATQFDELADRLAVAGSIMLVSSPILVVTSIPLLACAYYNRSKAKKMCLNVGASMLPSGGLSPFKASTPALSFSLTF